MYSSRSFYNYKVKNEYSPSMKKASTPNYYQRKGRIIQQTPLNLFNPPTEMMTKKKLDNYYKTLLKYKYDLPTIPVPIPTLPDPFMMEYNLSIGAIFPGDTTSSHSFGNAELLAFMSTQTLPALVAGYHYRFLLIGLGITTSANAQNTAQFFIQWYSHLISGVSQLNSYQIFIICCW